MKAAHCCCYRPLTAPCWYDSRLGKDQVRLVTIAAGQETELFTAQYASSESLVDAVHLEEHASETSSALHVATADGIVASVISGSDLRRLFRVGSGIWYCSTDSAQLSRQLSLLDPGAS